MHVSALEVFERHDLAIAGLDLGMPGMGGRQCLKELARLYPGLGIIIASGYLADSSEEEMKKQGAAGFIDKPCNVVDLLAFVRRILDNQQ